MVSIVGGNARAARRHSRRDLWSLGAAAAGVPVFLNPGLANHVVPQRAGFGLGRQAADHRAEERRPGRQAGVGQDRLGKGPRAAIAVVGK
jgi:hypothetical protein